VYDGNPGTTQFTYDLQFTSGNARVAQTTPASTVVITVVNDEAVFEPFASPYATCRTDYAPHGPTLYAGDDGETLRRYFWVDAGSSINWNIVASTFSGFTCDLIDLVVWRYNGGAPVLVQSIPGSSATVWTDSMSVSKSDYYAIGYKIEFDVTFVDQTYTVGLSIQSTGPVMCHRALPNLESNFASALSIRVLGASLKCTNQASPLNRQGKITGFEVPEGIHWTDYLLETGAFGPLSRSQGAYTIPAQRGLYGFLKPSKPDDFNFISHIDTSNGVVVDCSYPLKPKSSYLAIYSSISDPSGLDLYWTAAWSIEYLTSDVWREISASTISPESCMKALEMLRGAQQWHENPKHLSEIWNAIKNTAKKVIGGITKYGPGILSGIGQFGALL